jgi:hypothetical protein
MPSTGRQVYSGMRIATLKQPGIVRRLRAISFLMSVTTVAIVVTFAANEIARARVRSCRKRTSRRKFRASTVSPLRRLHTSLTSSSRRVSE